LKSRIIWVGVAFVIWSVIGYAAGRDIKINIYNGGFSQISETRVVRINSSLTEIVLPDVAEKIDPGSISIDGNGVEIHSIIYAYDLISTDRLLRKFINREITFNKDDSLEIGTLLGYDDDNIFFAPRSGKGAVAIYERDDFKYVELSGLPEALVLQPVIIVKAMADKPGDKSLHLSYLTEGLGWRAEYRLAYDPQKNSGFEGWVLLDNQCGAAFPEASIVLVAGQVDRDKPEGSASQSESGLLLWQATSKLEPLVDYHRFTLPLKATLNEMDNKQAPLFKVDGVKIDHYYKFKWSETKADVKSVIAFVNDRSIGLGFPIPPGRISIFDDASNAFLGSSLIEGTPNGEKVEIFMGTAFDIKAERKRIDHKKIGRDKNSDTFEIKIRNHKSEKVKVVAAEELYGYWEIVDKSDDFTKKDFQNIEFEVSVEPGKEKVITYTVEYSY